MTKRFRDSILKKIKDKRKRVPEMVLRICGRRMVNGKYRIANAWSGHYDERRMV